MEYLIKNNDVFYKIRRLDKYMANHKGFISGGCFKNIFTDTKFKDLDIFFNTIDDFNEALKYYKENDEEWTFIYENKNAVCFKNKITKVKIELIRSRFSDVSNMLNSFDFTIVKFAYFKDYSNDNVEYKVMYHPYFFEDLLNKKLVIDGDIKDIPFPIGTFNRSYKYQSYGFGMCRETKVKMVQLIQNQNPEDIDNNLYFGFD